MTDGGAVLGVIPARAGSKRLPGKNLRPMAGRPMIGWTFAAARAARTLDRIVVTSDDEAVLALAREAGLEAVRRPDSLAADDSPVVGAVEHVLSALGGAWDHVALLQPTSPLRLAEDIDGAVGLAVARGAPAAVGVRSALHPSSFHRRLGPDGVLAPLGGHDDGVVRVNGAIYAVRTAALLGERSFCPEGALAWVMPPERSWDVDTIEEFAACEAILAARSL